MKKLFSIVLAAILALSLAPFVFANYGGGGIGIGFETEDFAPLLWMCDNRKVIDDDLEYGRIDGEAVYSEKVETCELAFEGCRTACNQGMTSFCWSVDGGPEECWEWEQSLSCSTQCFEFTKKFDCDILKGYELIERTQNYAFEGEKLEWLVLVMDKNKIEEVTDVVATIGDSQGEGNDIEVECVRLNGFAAPGENIKNNCNARILEEELDQFDDQTMAYYECTLTVETPDSMEGEYWVTVEACSDSDCTTMDENEYWYFNPVIALAVDGGPIDFGVVRPGTIAYSDTILVGNDDGGLGTGVLLDMFISGTDFYDPASTGSRCVITNRLKLGNNFVNYGNDGIDWNNNECAIGFGDTDDHLCYYATNGAYSTETDPRSDAEGYAPIVYGDTFSRAFYNDAEIMQPFGPYNPGYQPGNIVAPGAEIAVTFKLGLPEPCTGDFTDGDIFFWGEAI